jgi:hypothetical protein
MARSRRRTLLVGAMIGAALAALWSGPVSGQEAARTTSQTEQLKTRAAGGCGEVDRLAALRELAALDTSDSRKALEELADAKDDPLATSSLFTIGRADQTGGRSKLKAVFEDTKRAHLARVAAFLACVVCDKYASGLSAASGRSRSPLSAALAAEGEADVAGAEEARGGRGVGRRRA